jgi:hypothetical protein
VVQHPLCGAGHKTKNPFLIHVGDVHTPCFLFFQSFFIQPCDSEPPLQNVRVILYFGFLAFVITTMMLAVARFD